MAAYRDASGRWRYRFTFRGKRYSGSTPKGSNTKKAAEALERAHQERLGKRAHLGVMPKVGEFVRTFLEHQRARVKPLTLRAQTAHLGHAVAAVGHVPLDEIEREHIDDLATRWSKAGVAVTTINTRLGTFQRLLTVANERRLIESVPQVKNLKVPKVTPRFLSEDEAVRLIAAASPRWRSMVVIGLRTGLRMGELRGLQWEDIDIEAARLIVRRTDPGVRGMAATGPKGGGFRVLPLTADAVAALEVSRAKVRNEWVWPGIEEWHGEQGRRRARAEGSCTRAMTAMAKRAKVDDCTWHTLRHTFASWLVMRGVSLRVVQELLGHASIKMTEKYAHLSPGFAQHAAVQMLDAPLVTKGLPTADNRLAAPVTIPR